MRKKTEQYLELTDAEIQAYRDAGYVVEELQKFPDGGAIEDVVYTYDKRPGVRYKKTESGWLINVPGETKGYVPIKDPDGSRTKELNYNAKPVEDGSGRTTLRIDPNKVTGEYEKSKGKDSNFENIIEVIDPTGITSWDDVYRSAQQTGWDSPQTGLEIAGALPLVGKVGKFSKFASKEAFKLLTDPKTIKAVSKKGMPIAPFAAPALLGVAGLPYMGKVSDAIQAYNEFELGGKLEKFPDGGKVNVFPTHLDNYIDENGTQMVSGGIEGQTNFGLSGNINASLPLDRNGNASSFQSLNYNKGFGNRRLGNASFNANLSNYANKDSKLNPSLLTSFQYNKQVNPNLNVGFNVSNYSQKDSYVNPDANASINYNKNGWNFNLSNNFRKHSFFNPSLNVSIPINRYDKGGEVITSNGWDYKKEGDKYLTKQTNNSDWIEAKGSALNAIKQKVYNEIAYTDDDKKSDYKQTVLNLIKQGYTIDDLVKKRVGTKQGLESLMPDVFNSNTPKVNNNSSNTEEIVYEGAMDPITITADRNQSTDDKLYEGTLDPITVTAKRPLTKSITGPKWVTDLVNPDSKNHVDYKPEESEEYVYSGRKDSTYKKINGEWYIKNKNTASDFVKIKDEDGSRSAVLNQHAVPVSEKPKFELPNKFDALKDFNYMPVKKETTTQRIPVELDMLPTKKQYYDMLNRPSNKTPKEEGMLDKFMDFKSDVRNGISEFANDAYDVASNVGNEVYNSIGNAITLGEELSKPYVNNIRGGVKNVADWTEDKLSKVSELKSSLEKEGLSNTVSQIYNGLTETMPEIENVSKEQKAEILNKNRKTEPASSNTEVASSNTEVAFDPESLNTYNDISLVDGKILQPFSRSGKITESQKIKVRNRGDKSDIYGSKMAYTYAPFKKYNENINKKYASLKVGDDTSVIALTENGLQGGTMKDYKNSDALVSPTYVTKGVSKLVIDDKSLKYDSNINQKGMGLKTKDGKLKQIPIGTKDAKDKKFGSWSGGHLIIENPKTKEMVVLHGRSDQLQEMFDKYLKANGLDSVNIYETDHKSYSLISNPENYLHSGKYNISQDNLNSSESGSGNFIYIEKPNSNNNSQQSSFKNGGTVQSWDAELTDSEIKLLRSQGYTIEELD